MPNFSAKRDQTWILYKVWSLSATQLQFWLCGFKVHWEKQMKAPKWWKMYEYSLVTLHFHIIVPCVG